MMLSPNEKNASRMCYQDLWNELRVLAHGCHVMMIMSQTCLREAVQHTILVRLAYGRNIHYL